MSNQKAIIIKKVKKNVGGGHHGGNWKVAYADFVTAMMAFFLLMWLLNMSSPEKRVRLSYYFKYFSIFSKSGTSFMNKSSEMFSESGQTRQKVFMDTPTDKRKLSNEDNSANESDGAGYLKGMEMALKQVMVDELGNLKDQVLVDTVQDGVRIQVIDKDGSDMFELGSSRLTPKAKEILHVIGQNISKLPNRIIIEGHTDALPFAGRGYSNWELSTERASSARKELEANGLNPERIMRVAGYADKDPLIKDNPADPRNRRISIILKIPPEKEKVKSSGKKSGSSLLKKDGKKFATGNKAESPVLILPGTKPVVKYNTVKKRGSPETGKRWSPVTGKEQDKPVINNSWAPVMNNKWSPVLKKNLKTDKGWSPDVEKEKNDSEPAKATYTAAGENMEKLSAATKNDDKSRDAKAASSINEGWKPVMKDNTWSPVLKKDKWSPVLNQD